MPMSHWLTSSKHEYSTQTSTYCGVSTDKTINTLGPLPTEHSYISLSVNSIGLGGSSPLTPTQHNGLRVSLSFLGPQIRLLTTASSPVSSINELLVIGSKYSRQWQWVIGSINKICVNQSIDREKWAGMLYIQYIHDRLTIQYKQLLN